VLRPACSLIRSHLAVPLSAHESRSVSAGLFDLRLTARPCPIKRIPMTYPPDDQHRLHELEPDSRGESSGQPVLRPFRPLIPGGSTRLAAPFR
jgi:hypothetical protein